MSSVPRSPVPISNLESVIRIRIRLDFVWSSVVFVGGGSKVKNGPAHFFQDQRTMRYTRGNKDHAALRNRVRLVSQPELDLAAQVGGIIGIGTEKGHHFSEIMRMAFKSIC